MGSSLPSRVERWICEPQPNRQRTVTEEDQISISAKNGRKLTITGIGVLMAIILQVITGAMQWQHSKDVEQGHDDRIVRLEAEVNDMELNGHPDHERRISKLEGMKADATAAAVVQQNQQIEKLIVAVQTDHDSIITLKAIFESQTRIK
jgi:hypothetical protein